MKDGFLQAIREEPDDDAHRLVYADWLSDHDDEPRAEFIRLQCALARRELDDPDAEPLRQREAELLASHGETWRLELPVLPRVNWSDEFRRGFIETAQVRNLAAWRDEAFSIVTSIPLRILSVWQVRPSTARGLARSSFIDRVRGLEFPTGHFEDADLEVIARYCRLREFAYITPANPETTLGPDARHIFATMPGFAGLERLDLTGVPLGNQGLARLSGAPNLVKLKKLHLRRCGITLIGAHALASHAGWSSLRCLNLSGNMIGDEGCRALASSPALQNLNELDLSGCNISASGATVLARSMFLTRLTKLSLNNNWIGSDGIDAITSSTNLQSLRHLEGNDIGLSGADVVSLLRSPLASHLRTISLFTHFDFAPEDFDNLLLTPVPDSLEWIHFGGAPDDRLTAHFGDRIRFATQQQLR